MKVNFKDSQGLRLVLAGLLVVAGLGAPALLNAADKNKSKVSEQMEVINDNYKTLRRAARGKELNEESVKLVEQMIAAAEKAKEMVPPMAEKKSGAEKDKFIADYKKEMDGMIATFKGLEADLKAKKYDEAAKTIDKLNEIKKKGHDKFTED